MLREKFRKRSSSFFRKANELAQLAEAQIYVVILRNNRYYTYKSTEQPNWPPSESDIVGVPKFATLNLSKWSQARYYPLSLRKGPADFKLTIQAPKRNIKKDKAGVIDLELEDEREESDPQEVQAAPQAAQERAQEETQKEEEPEVPVQAEAHIAEVPNFVHTSIEKQASTDATPPRKRRVFTIPRAPVLRRSPIGTRSFTRGSRTLI